MTPKEKRIIELELKKLFSVKSFLILKSIEEWKEIGFFHPVVRTDGNTHPLSEVGISALKRITEIMQKTPELRDSCSPKEIAVKVHESYEGWIKQSLQPDAAEFIEECCNALLSGVKERFYLVTLEGLELTEVDCLEFETILISKPNMGILSEVKFGGALTPDWVEKEFGAGLWLQGKSLGSPEVSAQRFEHHTILVVGAFAVCGAILFQGSIWQSHLHAAVSRHRRTTRTSVFCWEAGGDNPLMTTNWGSDKKLQLDAECIAYLRKECFLDELVNLPTLNNKTEIQESIERALYWFADAHGDRNTTMRFVKLWSCAECFFAITDSDVTEANVRGIATILTFVGRSLWSVEDYPKLKRRLKQLYELRSRAVHRAEYDGIQLEDLGDLSQWVAWVIVSMMALSKRGYRTLAEVKQQAVRLDTKLN